MQGAAQKLFQQKKGFPVYQAARWPTLDSLLSQKWLNYIDYSLAEYILDENGTESEAAFICHLSLASRAGNLCISITDQIYPSVESLWLPPKQSEVLPCNETYLNLKKLIIAGASAWPDNRPTVLKFGNLYYFQKHWDQEKLCIEVIKQVSQYQPNISVSLTSDPSDLLTEQSNAILNAFENTFTIICGGPGTGKTYTAGQLIRYYWEALPPHLRKEHSIALAAPTGKAASNLQKSILKSLKGIENYPPVQVKTLHALLGISPRQMTTDLKLAADLILIDESSMIDIELMILLLSAVKPGARVVLLGDPHQLPPVGMGNIFSDLIKFPSIKVTTLTKCLRTELQSIVSLAESMQKGDTHQVLSLLKSENGEVGRLTSCQQPDEIIEYALKFIPTINLALQPNGILNEFNRFRLLSPLREGPFGVDSLNLQIFDKIFRLGKRDQWQGFPIMITQTDYKKELFNGEMGVLLRKNSFSTQLQPGDYALFQGKEGQTRTIPALLLPKFEYAYCLSVHKSQGSEFDHVLLLVPQGSEVFGKEVLYTAVTRAKKRIELWGEEKTILATLANCSCRLSGLSENLRPR